MALGDLFETSSGDLSFRVTGDGDVIATDGTRTLTFDASAGSLAVASGSAQVFLDASGELTLSDGTTSTTLNQYGAGTVQVKAISFNHDAAASAQSIYTVPAGHRAVVLSAVAVVTTAFDGSTGDAAVDVGVTGGDTDAFLDGGDLTSTGTVGGTVTGQSVAAGETIAALYIADTSADGTTGTAEVAVTFALYATS